MDARPILPALVFALSALASARTVSAQDQAPVQTNTPPQSGSEAESQAAPAFKPEKLEQIVAPMMTFVVGQYGIVYQKDLGADTATAAGRITSFDPDKSWDPTGD